jgi:hypothetical protein
MTSGVTSEVPQEVTFESTTYQPNIFSVDSTVVEITTEYDPHDAFMELFSSSTLKSGILLCVQ